MTLQLGLSVLLALSEVQAAAPSINSYATAARSTAPVLRVASHAQPSASIASMHLGNRADYAVQQHLVGANTQAANIPQANTGSDINANAVPDANIKKKALKVSPQDQIYDPHEIDNDEKFHAPSLAPNDKQTELTDAAAEEKKLAEKANSGEAEKGNKGSVILDDYDPNRLGVSADEAYSVKKDSLKKEKDGKAKDSIPKDNFETGGKKDKKPAAKDAQEVIEENKASSQKSGTAGTTNTNTAATTKGAAEQQSLYEQDKLEAEKLKENADKYEQLKDSSTTSSGSSTASTSTKPGVPEEEFLFGRFVGSMAMIVASELGDKTFFIAAIMAMRHPPWFVFSSSYSAMVFMTVLSMVLGLLLPSLLSRKVTTLLAALLFVGFGVKMIMEAYHMDKDTLATEEMEEVEHDLLLSDATQASEKAEAGGLTGEDSSKTRRARLTSGFTNLIQLIFSPVWIQIFVMTFLGEWGDRSQIATVAMGAGQGWAQVLSGCLAGHFITTAIAVLGGKILAKHLSLRTITVGGAVCFLVFAVFYFHDWLSQ